MDELDFWFQRPSVKEHSKTRVERLIEIVRRVRKRLVNQRWALHCLERAYVSELEQGRQREKTIAVLRDRVTRLELEIVRSKPRRSILGWLQDLLR